MSQTQKENLWWQYSKMWEKKPSNNTGIKNKNKTLLKGNFKEAKRIFVFLSGKI